MRFRTRLYVDLGLLAENFTQLKELAPNNEVIFMVKADGYGHGMVPIVHFAITELNIKEFGVATLGEAKKLREELPDFEFEIYVFSDIQIESVTCQEIFLSQRIIPVISNMDDLGIFLDNPDFKHFPLFAKFNTGMNRLGILPEEVDLFIKKLKSANRLEVFHFMSHFSSSSLPVKTNKQNIKQYELFKSLKRQITEAGITIQNTSMANSGAIEQGYALEETHIRPGLMLYGPSAMVPKYRSLSKWKGKVISRLETYIINIFKVTKGQPIGYGATPCPGDGIVLIIALGYGDGFSTRFEGATLKYSGIDGKVAGRVNMDMAQVFFANSSNPSFKIGDKFEIWDHTQEKILHFSDQTKTIPYELFCQLTSRVPRVYGLQ